MARYFPGNGQPVQVAPAVLAAALALELSKDEKDSKSDSKARPFWKAGGGAADPDKED